MEDNAQAASKAVDRTEKDLLASLAAKEPSYSTLEQRLAKFRSACQDYILRDFAAAAAAAVEPRLWDAHSKVNQKFRPLLAQFRDSDGKRKPVERRKAEKLYLEFIKSSMRFYRGYIQRLASHFAGIPEIVEIARKFNLDTLSADTPLPVYQMLKKQIIRSCYLTLVQLGDLSRYRETELQTKERNWGPAKGYYDLATALDPTSGISSNQLAVVALADQDHLRAVYYLYRAVCIAHPAPQAQGNLDIGFKKIRKRSAEGKPILSGDAIIEGNRELQNSFLLFHARCFLNEDVGHENQQNVILSILAEELRERPYDTMIRKFCFINISAQDLAARRFSNDPSAGRSFRIAQQMNIATFSMLLKLLLDELQHLARGTESSPSVPRDGPPRMTPVIRRILPHLRLYSGWLLSTVQHLLANISLQVQVAAMWQIYAQALSLLNWAFPVRELPELPYLLDEDRDTLAFSPFSKFVKEKRFLEAGHRPKPVHNGTALGPQSSEDEMLYRVKCLVRDAVYLCKKDEFRSLPIPLTFANNKFIFHPETAEVESASVDPSLRGNVSSAAAVTRDDMKETRHTPDIVDLRQTVSEEVAGSMPSALEDMVNDLIQSETHEPQRGVLGTGDGFPTPVLRSPLAQPGLARGEPLKEASTVTARDLVQKVRHSAGALPQEPLLPSIWNSPFTSRPGETASFSSSRPSTAQHVADLGTALPFLDSFERELRRQKEEIELRTSPVLSWDPTPSTSSTTPTHLTSRVGMMEHLQPQAQLTPWRSAVGVDASHETVLASPRSEPSPYGAIGEPRPKSGRTPTSGQAG